MVMVSLEKNNLCFLTAHSLKCHLNQSKRVTFFKKVHLNLSSKSFTRIHKWYFILWNIMDNWSITFGKKKKKKEKMKERLTCLVLKYLIAKMKHKKGKNTKYLNSKYWIFKCSFIWTHILWCLLDFKTFDTLSTFSLILEFADHSNGLALLFSTRFPKTIFCVRKISICFIIKIIASILRCDV